MMRSWENRPDCSVVDEPFYACYLAETGLQHPCREAIIASQSTDRDTVVTALTAGPVATELHYQKHMTHHIPEGMDMTWCKGMRHCFLIRDPAEVIASYLQKMPAVDEEAIGIARQARLFDEIATLCGTLPVVIDSNDVLADPAGVLAATCAALDVPWLPESMLNWPAGPRASDGVWASHWYQNVEHSTGFGAPRDTFPELAPRHRQLAADMRTHYRRLAQYRLCPADNV
jgi:hypothetical protein